MFYENHFFIFYFLSIVILFDSKEKIVILLRKKFDCEVENVINIYIVR